MRRKNIVSGEILVSSFVLVEIDFTRVYKGCLLKNWRVYRSRGREGGREMIRVSFNHRFICNENTVELACLYDEWE